MTTTSYVLALLGTLAAWVLMLHGATAMAVVFAAPALEASTFVGVVFPGEIAVVLGGVLASQGRLSISAACAVAAAGAIVGDNVGYLVGRRFGRRILEHLVGRIIQRRHVDRAEDLLRRRAAMAVLLGRLTATLRALIPGLAGMARLPYRTFLLYNALGGVLWACGFVLLGYFAGLNWRHVETIASSSGAILVAVLVGSLILVHFVRRHGGIATVWRRISGPRSTR